jgi:DNA-binding GntR family transcriptional regulator
MIELAKRSNLAAQITDRLFEAILQGELKPGERIIETKMAKQLGVGQSTFREALQALEHRGLVTKERGTFVTRLTLRDFETLFAVRLELEPMAASMACGKLTGEHVCQLEVFLSEMNEARQRRDFITLVKNDIAFHQLIWELPQVSSLNRLLNLVLSPLFAFSLNTLFRNYADDLSLVEARFEREHKDHCRLLDALREGKPDEVKSVFQNVMTRYLQETLDDARAEKVHS